jgi:hypothetical protein
MNIHDRLVDEYNEAMHGYAKGWHLVVGLLAIVATLGFLVIVFGPIEHSNGTLTSFGWLVIVAVVGWGWFQQRRKKARDRFAAEYPELAEQLRWVKGAEAEGRRIAAAERRGEKVSISSAEWNAHVAQVMTDWEGYQARLRGSGLFR